MMKENCYPYLWKFASINLKATSKRHLTLYSRVKKDGALLLCSYSCLFYVGENMSPVPKRILSSKTPKKRQIENLNKLDPTRELP